MNKMKHSILIVDDEKIIRAGLVRALAASFTTYEAANGKEAMEIIKKHMDIKVVISDLKMPEVDGFELLGRIQATNNKIRVILVTAFIPFESADDLLALGAFDYMTKPVDIGKLETTIQNAIGNDVSTGMKINAQMH